MIPIIQNSQQLTMSSSQLADLLGYEKKEINRKVKLMFGDRIDGGKISPSLDSRGYVVEYNLPELESKMFVAKHDIDYLEMITEYWIKKAQPDWLLSLSPEAKLAIADIAKQRDEAIATKAQINDKRTATIMGRLGNATQKIKKLEDQLQDVGSYLSVIGAKLPQRVDTPLKDNVQSWRLLKQLSIDMQLEPKRVKDERYGDVLAYHVSVIDKFKAKYL